MNITDYIEIISTNDKVLHFKVKGFWSNQLIDQHEKAIFDVWKNAVDSFGGQKFISLPDLSEFKPAEEKGKALVARLMKYAQQHNLFHSVQVAPSAITPVSVAVSTNQAQHNEFRTVARSLEEAKKIVAEKLKEMD